MNGIQTAWSQHTCPLCGGPNACAPAASGHLDTPCWCRQATFSAELMAQVPASQRRVACICARCAKAAVTPHDHDSPPSGAQD